MPWCAAGLLLAVKKNMRSKWYRNTHTHTISNTLTPANSKLSRPNKIANIFQKNKNEKKIVCGWELEHRIEDICGTHFVHSLYCWWRRTFKFQLEMVSGFFFSLNSNARCSIRSYFVCKEPALDVILKNVHCYRFHLIWFLLCLFFHSAVCQKRWMRSMYPPRMLSGCA